MLSSVIFGVGVVLQGVVLQGVVSQGVVFQGVGASVELAGHDIKSLGSTLDWIIDASLDILAPVSPELGESLCRTHGLQLQKSVKQGQLWAMHMLDASSKLPSGLLTGNLIQLGNVDQCLAVNHVDPELGPIRGQHCQVSLGVENAMSAMTITERISRGSHRGTGLDQVEHLLSQGLFGDSLAYLGATWSMCVPASCSPGDLELHLKAALPGGLQVRVGDMACVKNQDPESRSWNDLRLLLWFILGCVSALVTAGTAYDLVTKASTSRNQTLVAFSLQENGKSLLQITTSPEKLASFDGLRCISVLWTILVHHFVIHMNTPSVNYRTLEAFARDWTHLLINNGTMSVDSLFVISGALVAFNFLRDRERNAKFCLWRYYLNRSVRMTPTHLMMLLIIRLDLDLVTAPEFRLNNNQIVESCSKFGWMGPLYLTNYFDVDHTCLGQVWSNSVDMHLFLISPILLFPLWRSPRLGGVLLLFLGVVSTGTVFSEAYRIQATPLNVHWSSVTSFDWLTLYHKTHLRATPWLIGVALGYLLHKTKGRQDVLSSVQTALGWTTSLLLTSYSFLSAHAYYQPDTQMGGVGTALYVALMRPTWAVGVAWVLFACERRRGGAVNAFLAWPGWQVPSKLCYAIFFINFNVIGVVSLLKRTPQYFSNHLAMVEFLGVVVVSVLLGAILYLAIEAPCCRVYRLHMRSETTHEKKVL